MYMAKKWPWTDEQVEAALHILEGATKANPITSEYLGDQLGLNDIEGNWKARNLISEVIRRTGLPLAANGRGYYKMETLEDLKEYRESLQRRIVEMTDRISLAERSFLKAYGKLPELTEEITEIDG